MDQDTKDDISQIQQAGWKLQQAVDLLKNIEGMERCCNALRTEIVYLMQEMDERKG